MPKQDVAATKIAEHRQRHLAGERALLLLAGILGPETDLRPSQQLLQLG